MLLTLLDCLLGNSRSSHSTLACFLGTLIAASAAAQLPPPPLDLDRDGVPDIVIRQVRANPAEPAWGRIVVQSGADGRDLLSVVGPEANDLFGWVVANLGDIDGDGIPDLAVAAPRGRTALPGADPEAPPEAGALGRVHLIAGADGSILRSIGVSDFGYFGFALRSIADFDRDGLRDLLVAGMHVSSENPGTGHLVLTHYWALVSTRSGQVLMQDEGSIESPFRAPDEAPRRFWQAGQVRGPRVLDFGFAGDVDADGDVDFADLLWLLAHWGAGHGAPRAHPDFAARGDLDASGSIAFPDLLALLQQFGRSGGGSPSAPRHHCWDYCSCHQCEAACPDDMDCPPGGGGCQCCGDPCCNDPCCQSDDPCSTACGGPCNPACWQSSTCICNPCMEGCGGCGGGPYPGEAPGGGYPIGGPCELEDPCDCDDNGNGSPNYADPQSPCYEHACTSSWTHIGRLILTIPAQIRLEIDPAPTDPEAPRRTPVIWTNNDDDNQNGVPDYADMGGYQSQHTVDFEEDMIPLRIRGSFCGTDPQWSIESTAGMQVWYDAGSHDLRDEVVGQPWPEVFVRERIAGGKTLRLIPHWIATPAFWGNPKAWSGRLYIEFSSPAFELGGRELRLAYSAVPNAGGPRQAKQALLPITPIELQVHDLRAWGPVWQSPNGHPAISNLNLDSGAMPVGGAITDGASICLLRLKAPPHANADPLRTITAWSLKRLETSAQQFESPTAHATTLPDFVGVMVTFQDGQPVLPPLPQTEGAYWGGGVGGLVDGKAFYVPPESYTASTQNNAETCLLTLRCKLGSKPIPGGRSFILRRPPIVLVHGILSDPGIWDYEYWNESGTPVPTRLYKVDYSATNMKGFPENYPKVVQLIDQALQEYRSASDAGHAAERGFKGIRYAATRADVVGHSQGGQLARWYIADTSAYGPSVGRGGGWLSAIDNFRAEGDSQFRWPYLRSDNFGAGSIRRFIPLNSPFRGSPLATGINHTVLSPTLTYGNPIVKTFIGGDALLDYVIDATQAANEPTCVADLAAASPALFILRAAAYPLAHKRILWHPIATRVRDQNGNDPPSSWRFSSAMDRFLTKNATTALQDLRTDNSDWVVSVCSQLNLPESQPGPCLPGPGRLLDGIPHSSRYADFILLLRGPPASAEVRNVVDVLVSSPASGTLFDPSWSLGQ